MVRVTWHAFYISNQGQWWHGISIIEENKQRLGFATIHPLQLNGWNDMGLTTQ
jgi:hypothetical protein